MQVDSHSADKPQAGPVQAIKKAVGSGAAGSTTPASPAASSRPASPGSKAQQQEEFIPEVDIYLTLLTIVHLLDNKELEKVRAPFLVLTGVAHESSTSLLTHSGLTLMLQSKELADVTVARLSSFNRRSLDQLAAKVYFYYGRLHEIVGGSQSLADIRPCVSSFSRNDSFFELTFKLTLHLLFSSSAYLTTKGNCCRRKDWPP